MICSTILAGIFSIFQDNLGRKRAIIYSFLFGLTGVMCIHFGRGVELKVFGVMCLWTFMKVAYSTFALLSNELLVNPLRNISTGIYSVFVGVGGLFGIFCTRVVADYQSLILVNFSGYTFTIVLIGFYLQESPSFLVKRAENAELENVIQHMCIVNGANPIDSLEIEEKLDIAIESNSNF